MVKTLIEAFPSVGRIPDKIQEDESVLNISEHFYDTIQGENLSGNPAVFLRLQNCTLNCVWCDTSEVWRKGNPYSISELLKMWEQNGIVDRFKNNHRLIITGGSPLLQQESISALITSFISIYGFKPKIEIENECMIKPSYELSSYVNVWNNSPKLSNSGMKKEIRYKPNLLWFMSSLSDSYFKFVITSEEDWKEIEEDFIKPKLLIKSQIVLMPEGVTREELQKHYQIVVDIACREGVRMCDRMHVTIWDKKVGV